MVGEDIANSCDRLSKVFCVIAKRAKGEMDVKKNFEEICLSLNMDRETADSAWSIYQKIDEDYGLEVSLIRLVVVNDIKKFT